MTAVDQVVRLRRHRGGSGRRLAARYGMLGRVTSRPDCAPGAPLHAFLTPDGSTADGLRPTEVAGVPGIRLWLAEDAIVLAARLEAHVGRALPVPYWASAWAGGQAVARHLTEHPEIVVGRRVLDVASGSGLVAIAAARAGAATVTANDIDRYAVAAIGLNARLNAVRVEVDDVDLLDGDGAAADVVLAGDVFYDERMAERMLAFLERVAARGALVLVGDPGRQFLPMRRLQPVASYPLPSPGAAQDAQVGRAQVLRLAR